MDAHIAGFGMLGKRLEQFGRSHKQMGHGLQANPMRIKRDFWSNRNLKAKLRVFSLSQKALHLPYTALDNLKAIKSIYPFKSLFEHLAHRSSF